MYHLPLHKGTFSFVKACQDNLLSQRPSLSQYGQDTIGFQMDCFCFAVTPEIIGSMLLLHSDSHTMMLLSGTTLFVDGLGRAVICFFIVKLPIATNWSSGCDDRSDRANLGLEESGGMLANRT